MKMTKWMMAAAFGLLTMGAFAQTAEPAKTEKPKREHRASRDHARSGKWKENVEEYKAALKLSPEQVTQWQALNTAKKEELKSLKGNTALGEEEKKAQMKAIRQDKQAQLKSILSQEQFAQYQDLRKAKMKERKMNRIHKKGAR